MQQVFPSSRFWGGLGLWFPIVLRAQEKEKNTDISINLQNTRGAFNNICYCAGISIQNMNMHMGNFYLVLK